MFLGYDMRRGRIVQRVEANKPGGEPTGAKEITWDVRYLSSSTIVRQFSDVVVTNTVYTPIIIHVACSEYEPVDIHTVYITDPRNVRTTE